MSFLLPDLTFDYDALEPHIDAETMQLHYTKHHLKYMNKLNDAIKDTELDEMKPEQIFAQVSQYSDAVRNNGGGYYNHSLFWKVLSPPSQGIEDVELYDAVNKYFGTIENMKEEFTNAALNQFGSGWAWLIKKDDGELLVFSTDNQDNPLMDVSPIKGKPILCIDIWEHAYYLKYQNSRSDYLKAFWNVVNWRYVAELYNH